MNKLKLISLGSLTVCAATLCPVYAASGSSTVAETLRTRCNRSVAERVIDAGRGRQQRLVSSHGFDFAAMKAPEVTPISPEAMRDADRIGVFSLPDGTNWYYSLILKHASLNQDGSDVSVAGFSVKVFDENFNPKGTVNGSFKLQGDETRIVSIDISDMLTRKFFHYDDNYEMMVLVTANTPQYINNTYTYVYTLDEKSTDEEPDTPVSIIDGVMVNAIDASPDNFTEVYYMTFTDGGYVSADGSFTKASQGTEADGEPVERFSIYEKAGYDGQPRLMGNLDLPAFAPAYSDGVPYMAQLHDNTLWVALCGYEKPYLANPDDLSDWTLTPDNHFNISLYSMPLNGLASEFTLSKVTSIPVEDSTDPDVPFYLYGVGLLDYMDDMTFDVYDNSGMPVYIVDVESQHLSADYTTDSFYAIAADGTRLATIFENARASVPMSNVAGFPEQWCFLTDNDSGTANFNFVDISGSGRTVTVESSLIPGNSMTTSIDRVPTGNSYSYVCSLAMPQYDADGHNCQVIAWINADGTLNHTDRIWLGDNVAAGMPYINQIALSPWLADTDSKQEYFFLVKRFTGNSTETQEELMVVNNESEILLEVGPSDELGAITSVWFANMETSPMMSVMFYDNWTQEFAADFYNLPFEKFTKGGSGTADDPYLVSTVGDLREMAKYTEAHFRLADNIDASGYSIIGSLNPFYGSFDGAGHIISNLRLTGTSTGLLGNLTINPEVTDHVPEGELPKVEGRQPYVKDLVLLNPVIAPDAKSNLGSACGTVAAAVSQYSYMENVHVYGLRTEGSSFPGHVGGLAGKVSGFSEIRGCSVTDAEIDFPSACEAGGIAASVNTGSKVMATSFKGNIKAGESTGGIAGSLVDPQGNSVVVADCRVDADIVALNTVGGIAGDAGGNSISNCIFVGSVISTENTLWNGPCIGGIAGVAMGELKGNIADIKDFSYSNEYPRPENPAWPLRFRTAHFIAGMTPLNEDPEISEDLGKEPVFNGSDNYTINGITITDSDCGAATDTPNGELIGYSDLTTAMFSGIGYKFGQTVSEPWKGADGTLPVMWYVADVRGLSASAEAISIPIGSEATVSLVLVGGNASDIKVSVANDAIARIAGRIDAEDETTLTLSGVAYGSTILRAEGAGFSVEIPVTVKGGEITAIGADIDEIRMAPDDIRTVVFEVAGGAAADLTIYSILDKVVKVTDRVFEGNKATVTIKGGLAGSTRLIAEYGDITATVYVYVDEKYGVSATGTDPGLRLVGTVVMAEAGENITLFSVDGKTVASAKGSVNTAGLPAGVYVAAAAQSRLKVVVR